MNPDPEPNPDGRPDGTDATLDVEAVSENKIAETREANTPSLDDLTESALQATAALDECFEDMSLDAGVTPGKVVDLTPNHVTFRRTVTVEEDDVIGPLDDEYAAFTTVYTRALDTGTIHGTDGMVLWGGRKLCENCEVAFSDATLDECPSCNNDVETPATPESITVEQTVTFDTPLLSIEDLADELNKEFGTEFTASDFNK